MENYMESLAREYKKKLEGSESPEASSAIDIIHEQLCILNAINTPRKKVISYLVSLKEYTLNRLSMLGENKKIPSCRLSRKEGGLNKIVDLQIELFMLLDTLNLSGGVPSQLMEYENRFTALLGNLRQ
ncbi:MAG: hypothetical protein J6V83_01910 [Clostridia bacterium]|nr:hypothetical protein [Clostridia bacterium]